MPVSDIETLQNKQVDIKLLAERGVEIFFTQVFRDSFFHADMHPGNIFVDCTKPDDPRYIAVDCAIVGQIDEQDLYYLARNLLAIFQQDYRLCAKLHIECGWVPPDTSIAEFESALRTLCEPVFERPLSDISFGQMLVTLFRTAGQFDMQVQPQLVLLQKTLLNIEGLGRELYPELNLWDTAKPFLEQWIADRYSLQNVSQRLQQEAPALLETLPLLPDLILNRLRQTPPVKQPQPTPSSWVMPLAALGMLALGLGMGTPLVLIGTLGSQLLPKPGTWMTRVKALFGFVLLGMAIWFIARIIPDAIELGLWGALGLGVAISLASMARNNGTGGVLPQVATASAAIIGLWSALIMIGAAGGADDPWRPLSVYAPSDMATASQDVNETGPIAFDDVDDLDTLKRRIQAAANSGQMTLIEFTADWCVSCEVIEQEVFSDPTVKNEIQNVQRLSVDVTDYDAEDQAIMQHFDIVGPPTLMWFGPNGQEQRGARIIGELDAEAFLDRYEQARQSVKDSREG